MLSRRGFFKGLLGLAAVAAAGCVPLGPFKGEEKAEASTTVRMRNGSRFLLAGDGQSLPVTEYAAPQPPFNGQWIRKPNGSWEWYSDWEKP